MRPHVIVSVLAVLLLAGCGSDERPSASPPGTTPTATAARAPVTGAIDFTWSGTIAGRDDTLRIEADGSATLRSRSGTPQTLDLPDAVVAHVREDLEAANVASLAPSYHGPPVSDGSTESITVAGKRVATENGGGPPALTASLSDLTDIVANADSLVRFALGVRTTIGPDLAIVNVTNDGTATVIKPGLSPETSQLERSEVTALRRALDATPFESGGKPGYVDYRTPLDEGQVRLAYRWLTLTDPPSTAGPAIRILKRLVT